MSWDQVHQQIILYVQICFIFFMKKIHVKNTGLPNPTYNLIGLNPFLTRLKWLVLTRYPFDLQPDWPDLNLTRLDPPVLPCLLLSK